MLQRGSFRERRLGSTAQDGQIVRAGMAILAVSLKTRFWVSKVANSGFCMSVQWPSWDFIDLWKSESRGRTGGPPRMRRSGGSGVEVHGGGIEHGGRWVISGDGGTLVGAN